MTSAATLHPSFTLGTTALCPYNDETPRLFERWFADQQLVRLMGDWEFHPLPHYGQTATEYTLRTRKTTWLVCDLANGTPIPIGYTGLYLQPRHRVGILRLAIAEKEHQRHGHGHRATQLALRWAFQSLDLFALHLSVSASNAAAIALYRRNGFRECGRYRLSRFEPGGRHDEILMEFLREDWKPET